MLEINVKKILYLNFAKIYEFKSFEEFENNVVDLDMTQFLNDLTNKDGYCVYQEGSYYLAFDDGEIQLKVDKKFNDYFINTSGNYLCSIHYSSKKSYESKDVIE